MCLYVGLEVGSDWRAYVMDIAKSQVKQQLIFYHIMNVEGLKPTEEKFNALFDEYLVNSLTSSGITPDKYETEAEYLEAKEKFKQRLITNKGEDFFWSMFCYNETMKGIKSFAKVVEITE
jgi:FKBP-type peptidyl-prolyl cis-trans isomerase (trigger factor)